MLARAAATARPSGRFCTPMPRAALVPLATSGPPKLTPRASPSGMLCRAMAMTISQIRCRDSAGTPSILITKCSCGAKRFTSCTAIAPSASPSTTSAWPIVAPSGCCGASSSAGEISERKAAVSMTPAADPPARRRAPGQAGQHERPIHDASRSEKVVAITREAPNGALEPHVRQRVGRAVSRSPSFAMRRLVLLRHGQSQWNAATRFTGWADVDLTSEGEAQAEAAGRLLRAQGLELETAFSSVLTRAIRTLWIVLQAGGQAFVPEHKTWRLNERHYGALTGLKKDEAAERFGAEQIARWRRGYSDRPPPMGESDHQALARGRPHPRGPPP